MSTFEHFFSLFECWKNRGTICAHSFSTDFGWKVHTYIITVIICFISVVQKMQKLSESPVTSHVPKYVLMTLQTEKSLRNVINQSPHAHINENIKNIQKWQ